MYVVCGSAGCALERGEGQRVYQPNCCGPTLPSPRLEILNAGICSTSGWLLRCCVGLGWLHIARVETAIKEFILAASTEIRSCCFPSELLSWHYRASYPLLFFVTKRRNSENRVTAQATTGDPKISTPRRFGPRARTNNTEWKHSSGGPKQPATARSTQCAPEQRKQSNTQHQMAVSATE